MIISSTLISILTSVSNPTYDKDIKPIFEAKCAMCHHPGWADKNWLNYDIAKRDKDRIKQRVVKEKTMPPGNITDLSEEERELIGKWVDQGAKK